MEVAIIVIVVFVVMLVAVIISIRLCNKYNCFGCCENDGAESLDDLEVAAEDNQSDTLDDVDEEDEGEEEQLEDTVPEPVTRVMEIGDLNANIPNNLQQGQRQVVCDDDDEHVTLEIDGEEFVLNRLEESLL